MIAVGIGANLGERAETITQAISLIEQQVGKVVRKSSFVETAPLNSPDNPDLKQPPYLNGVILVESELTPEEAIKCLLEIETRLGRKRDKQLRWGPRVIDLDIIAYNEEEYNLPGLTIPHPEMHRRDFVLVPLCEIWPDWRHPVLNKTALEIYRELS